VALRLSTLAVVRWVGTPVSAVFQKGILNSTGAGVCARPRGKPTGRFRSLRFPDLSLRGCPRRARSRRSRGGRNAHPPCSYCITSPITGARRDGSRGFLRRDPLPNLVRDSERRVHQNPAPIASRRPEIWVGRQHVDVIEDRLAELFGCLGKPGPGIGEDLWRSASASSEKRIRKSTWGSVFERLRSGRSNRSWRVRGDGRFRPTIPRRVRSRRLRGGRSANPPCLYSTTGASAALMIR
jgi:hypothetical protein